MPILIKLNSVHDKLGSDYRNSILSGDNLLQHYLEFFHGFSFSRDVGCILKVDLGLVFKKLESRRKRYFFKYSLLKLPK